MTRHIWFGNFAHIKSKERKISSPKLRCDMAKFSDIIEIGGSLKFSLINMGATSDDAYTLSEI